MTIYYKRVVIWCAYPWQDEIEEQYVEFYERKKRKFVKIESLGKMATDTSIKYKEDYIKKELGINKVEVKKIN